MGGKNSKDDFYQQPPQNAAIKLDGFSKSPKSVSAFMNSTEKTHPNKQPMNFKYVNGGAGNQFNDMPTTHQFDENNLMKPVRNLDNGTKMTLSKRQQNVLPQMTQRVLSQHQMVLCKAPIYVSNNNMISSPARSGFDLRATQGT